jgi:hypothetical protein
VITVLDPAGAGQASRASLLACPEPGCTGWLRVRSTARSRPVRGLDGRVQVVRPDRGRCRACWVTQVLLPAFCLPRRGYRVEVIGAALLAAADGAGHTRAAAACVAPVSTVRDWIRAVTRGQPQLLSHAVGVLQTVGDPAVAWPSPQPLTPVPPLAAALHALAAAARGLGIWLLHPDPPALTTAATTGTGIDYLRLLARQHRRHLLARLRLADPANTAHTVKAARASMCSTPVPSWGRSADAWSSCARSTASTSSVCARRPELTQPRVAGGVATAEHRSYLWHDDGELKRDAVGQLLHRDYRGDGTVFRYAATPLGGGSMVSIGLAQTHGALAAGNEAAALVRAVLTDQRERGIRLGAGDVGWAIAPVRLQRRYKLDPSRRLTQTSQGHYAIDTRSISANFIGQHPPFSVDSHMPAPRWNGMERLHREGNSPQGGQVRIHQILLRGVLVVGLAGAALGGTAGAAQAASDCAGLWTQSTYYYGLGSVQYNIGVGQRNAGNYSAAQIEVPRISRTRDPIGF